MSILRYGPESHVRRPGYVAALRELSHPRAAEPDGAVLPVARLRMRSLLPGPGGRVRRTRAHLRRLCLLLLVLGRVAPARSVLYRHDRLPAVARRPEPCGGAGKQRRLPAPVL